MARMSNLRVLTIMVLIILSLRSLMYLDWVATESSLSLVSETFSPTPSRFLKLARTLKIV